MTSLDDASFPVDGFSVQLMASNLSGIDGSWMRFGSPSRRSAARVVPPRTSILRAGTSVRAPC